MKQLYLNMRLWLIALFSLVGLQTAWADEVTWTAADAGYENGTALSDVTINNFITVLFDKGTNNNAPKYYTTGSAVRAYGGNTFTFSATGKVISEITFTFASGEGTNTITADTGEFTTPTWTGSASEVTFTIGGTTGHRRIAGFTVIYADDSDERSESYVSFLSETPATGIVGGQVELPSIYVYRYGINDNVIAIPNAEVTWESSKTDVATVSNGSVFFVGPGTATIKASYAGNDSFKPSSESFTITVTRAPYTSIAAMLEDITSTQTPATYQFRNLLVTYVNGKNTYVSDGSNGFLFFGSDLGLVVGQRIYGTASGQLYLYNGLPEMSLSAEGLDVETLSMDNIVTPSVITASALAAEPLRYTNMLVKLEQTHPAEDISVEEGASVANYDLLQLDPAAGSDVTTKLRNNFKIALDMAADKSYDVTGLVSIYNGTVQLYPISVEEYSDQSYPISVISEHGSVELFDGITSAAAGDLVQFYLYGEEGWYSWSYNIVCGEEEIYDDFVDGVHSFVMPAGPVTITHLTKQKHSYTVAATENGTVTATSAGTQQGFSHEGRVVNITVTPDEGCMLDQLTVATPDGAPVEVIAGEAEGTYSFTMPDADVIITGTFMSQPTDDYERALAAIENGASYRVFTQVGESKLYLNTAGYLVSEAKKAECFTFQQVNVDGTFKPAGWNLGCKFTNPSLTNGASGDIVQNGHINVGNNNRNDWERQVFFLNEEGKFAVRATNANSENWGANTFWDVVGDVATLPEAGYSLEAAYVWQIEPYTDLRPAAFAKIQTWPAALQEVFGLQVQWTTNAQETSEGSIANINDGNIATFFHSQWSGTGPDEDHYIQAQLPEAAQKFIIAFHKRNDSNRPTCINVSAADGPTAQTITEGLPAPAWYGTSIDLGTAADNVRFTVTSTNAPSNNGMNNGHYFFTFGEFYIIASNNLTEAAATFLAASDYTNLNDDDVALIDALDVQIQNIKEQQEMPQYIAELQDKIRRLQLYVDATDTYQGESAAATANQALGTITAAINNNEYADKAQVDAASERVSDIANTFFAEIVPNESIDITDWYIVNPTPTANGNGWTLTATATFDSANNVAEFWNKSAATIKQAVELPAANFRLTAQAFTRTDMLGKLFAGEEYVNLVTVANSVVNDRTAAGTWFDAGNGNDTICFKLQATQPIEIGITADTNSGDHWTVWRAFKLELLPSDAEEEILIGDANLDGEVTTSDAVLAVSFALEAETPTEEQFAASDVNNSNDITVSDAVAIVNLALEIEPESNEFLAPAFAGNNSLTLRGYDICLANTTSFVAFQMDLTLADGAQLRGVSLSERAMGLNLTYRRLSGKTWRIAAYSLSNTAISGNAGTLLRLDIAGNSSISVSNIEFADARANAHCLTIDAATAIDAIPAEPAPSDIYTVNGLRTSVLHKGVNVIRKADGSVNKVLVK